MAISPSQPESGLSNFMFVKKMPRWPSWQFLIFAWPFAGMAFLSSFTAFRDARVATRQAFTTAVITGYDRPNHNQTRYAFTVSGCRFTGESPSAGTENPPLDSIQPVFYDSQNPQTNSLQNYKIEAPKEWSFITFLSGIAAIIVAVVGASKLWKRFDDPRR